MTKTLMLVMSMWMVPAALAAPSQPSTNPGIEILRKADTAIKAVKAVRFSASAEPTGVALNFVQPATGEGYMSGWNGAMPERFYVHVKTRAPGAESTRELTGGGDGETYFIIDHSSKKAYEDMDPNVFGSSGGTLLSVGMMEFVHDAPFDNELAAERVELQGVEEVDGEPCHKVHVVYNASQESTWFFSKNDFLPRRRLQKFSFPPQGEGTVDIRIGNLEVSPEVDPSLFKLSLPDGFEQIDDFAP